MWVFLSLLSAFFLASSDAVTKHYLRDENEYMITWLRYIFSLPPLLLIGLWIDVPDLDSTFWLVVFIALPMEILAIVLYIKAIKVSDLSLVLPFLSLTPVFLIFVSWVILAERVTVEGAAGIFFVALGGYTLQASSLKRGVLEPLRVLARDRGVIYMVIVALLYSFTSTLGKKAILHSSPLFFPLVYFPLVTVFFTPLTLLNLRTKRQLMDFKRELKGALLAGLLYGMMIVSHMLAIGISEVSYMIAIKRSSMLIGSIYGFLFFKEKSVRERLLGGGLMFAGIVIIILWGKGG